MVLKYVWKVGEWKRIVVSGMKTKARKFSMLPHTQYDLPFPKRLQPRYVLTEYWETIPLFVTTVVASGIVLVAIVWTFCHKVDVVFTSHSRDNISRTMDLRNPTVHKMLTINQQYEPWPEMADLLEKMRAAEQGAVS